MKILVTGAAGFIGADVTRKLLSRGHEVTGLDNFSDYYDVSLKRDRQRLIEQDAASFLMHEIDICDRDRMARLFDEHRFDVVVHLAAQAGVRYSIENPEPYIDTNLVGFANVIEQCRRHQLQHLVYASSSSVYGASTESPFPETARVDNPLSLYAATKRANELMAHSYWHLYGLRCTGLRFFTVYGPWGRPDMAPFIFASRILEQQPIPVYNGGNMIRDFTYIDDISEGVVRVAESSSSEAACKLYNIGRGQPVMLMDFIAALERSLGVKAILEMLPMQDGDVPRTLADTTKLETDFGYRPQVSMDDGVKLFADWYLQYRQISRC